MRVHFIAVGGSAMHNLAIALKKKGYEVSGSDDEIFEPSRGRLASYGLLPEKEGWDEGNIHEGLDAVILGMHARGDNPELLMARKLGLDIYSYPEYLYEQSREKLRVVIGGSHGKTTITAMIMHVLKFHEKKFDYMVGANLQGFDIMVSLTADAPLMVFEGDEYLSSALDPRPKFHLYRPHIALLSGIAWDHINVFPTYDLYVEQFRKFIEMIEPGGSLVYFAGDKALEALVQDARGKLEYLPYGLPGHLVKDGKTSLKVNGDFIPLNIFGEHNLLNLEGARLVCGKLGLSDGEFYDAISTFTGASNRLELVDESDRTAMYKDFAHSPSKLKASIEAMKQQYPDRVLVACMELHTFSSLSEGFLSEYKETMKAADLPLVYFNPHTIKLKKLAPITEGQVKSAFACDKLKVFTSSSAMENYLLTIEWNDKNLLMMSSGNFDGIGLSLLAGKILGHKK